MEKIYTNNCTYLLGAQPVVTLLNATPEWVVAQATKGYTGVYTASPMAKEDQELFWEELGATKLKGPLEMANTFWLIEDVSRAFTHQIARYRIGFSMVQESQRFSRQEGELARIMVPSNIAHNSELERFIDGCETAMETYFAMLGTEGVETQDARAILPTNICTRLYATIAVNSLAHIYEQRHCCQAQAGEWTSVVRQFKEKLLDNDYPHYAGVLQAPWENPNCTSCGFGASFDRPCRNQKLFDANLEKLYWKGK